VRFAETVLQRTVSNLVPQSASQKGFETYPIRIADPIPVYLMNLTAQVGFDIRSNGRILNYKPIRLFPDYYGQDRRWAEVLSRSQNGETL
jgi:murein L,D-transpeptidase YcbB/YkuD